ncbi:hypothetical protein SMMN14_01349 [Sphaerulina musiva]
MSATPKLDSCLESMKGYLIRYMTVHRPGPLPEYLVICAGHPCRKVMVSIVSKEQFEHLNRENDQVMVDDEYEVELYWTARRKREEEERISLLKKEKGKEEKKKGDEEAREKREREKRMTKRILDFDILGRPRPKQTLNFNGVDYEIILKDSPVGAECWCDEEQFCGLFKAQGTQILMKEDGTFVTEEKAVAKEDVLFFDLIAVANEKAAADALREEEEKRKETRKAKRDRQRAAKKAAEEAAREAKERRDSMTP